MKILAVYTIKGGVGKTAAAVNIAAEAAASGANVLLWDLDPQGASSYYFRVHPKVRGAGARMLENISVLENNIKATDIDNLDMMPADFSYRNLDLLLDETDQPKKRLRQLLKGLEEYYDLIVLDCPPGITLLSENVMMAADALLVPVVPTTLSLRTLEQLEDFVAGKKFRKVQILPFLSMVDRRRTMHREIASRFVKEQAGALKTAIPSASVVERMGVEQAPLRLFAPRSAPARAFGALWREVRKRLG